MQAEISPTVIAEGGGWRFRYSVTIETQSPQPLLQFQINCPPEIEGRINRIEAFVKEQRRSFPARHGVWAGHPSCMVLYPLQAGEKIELLVTAELLPSIGEARLIGSVGRVVWPDSFNNGLNDRVFKAIRNLTGFTGGWKSVPMVVPSRNPEEFPPGPALRALLGDLAQSCGLLRWIRDGSLCASLRSNLEQAIAALEAGRTHEIPEAMEAFLMRLDEQHGPDPSFAVGAEAYALLRPMAQHVLAQL